MNFDPTLYLVSDSSLYTTEEFLKRIEDACRGGLDFYNLGRKTKKEKNFWSWLSK